jgi:heme/copper-type cytochrome/quinol oxidase subunit 2
MWNWILLIAIVGGLVALLTVAAVRQRRYSGDKPIGQQHKENVHKESRGERRSGGLGKAG